MFLPIAVLIGNQYVVSGSGSIALNITHPSPLEDGRLVYRLYLTPDLLPLMEELLLPGTVTEETHIQVSRERDIPRYGNRHSKYQRG